MLKKLLVTGVGGFILFVAAIFVILPGPALVLAPIGLAILSLEYDWAKSYLRKCQSLLSSASRRLDHWIAEWKYKRSRY